MNSAPSIPRHLSALPVFPLPKAVLFPGTVLPLHIFESRYLQMVQDAIKTDKLLAIAQLKPGQTPDGAQPDIYRVAGLGSIIHSEKLDDGKLNILVQGQERVRLVSELPLEKSFRRFQAEVIPAPSADDLGAAAAQLGRLQSCVLSLRAIVAEHDEQLCDVLQATSDPIALSDILSAAVVPDAAVQQELLATEVFPQRIERLIEALADYMVQKTPQPPSSRELN